MNPPVDLPRLNSLLGAAELRRVVDALQRRMELGRALSGALILSSPTEAERVALDSLFGRKATRGKTVKVDLDELHQMLRDARIAGDLRDVLHALRGPIVDRRASAGAQASAWAAMWRDADTMFASWPTLRPWIDAMARLGTLRRLSGNDPEAAAILLRDLARVAAVLPGRAEPLPSLAARLFGDAHALDPGTPRATLAVRAAARLGGVEFENDAEGRRAAWANVGVMCDELSTPVLVLNLAIAGETPLARLLREAAANGEPLHLSLRLLLRSPLGAESRLTDRDVFICENPTIVALAASRLGRQCAPLVCVSGQFATPALVMLRQLRDAGARLHYHGDFDPAGLVIARRVFRESGARPWRYGEADYCAAPKGKSFVGKVSATPWSLELEAEMQRDGRAVHEEAVFDWLVQNLKHGPIDAGAPL